MELIKNAIERAVTPKQRSRGFAKIIASLLLGLGALVCADAGAQDMEAISQAKAAATAWLALVDAGNYAGSWEQSAGLFKAALSPSSWASAARAKRAPLGALKLREVNSTAFTRKMPGSPDGCTPVSPRTGPMPPKSSPQSARRMVLGVCPDTTLDES